jgi:hypothetical protein
MFTEYYLAKKLSKASSNKPEYRQCKRCGYQILFQLPGCPNCNGLSDEEVKEQLLSKKVSAKQPPDLGLSLILYIFLALFGLAAIFVGLYYF